MGFRGGERPRTWSWASGKIPGSATAQPAVRSMAAMTARLESSCRRRLECRVGSIRCRSKTPPPRAFAHRRRRPREARTPNSWARRVCRRSAPARRRRYPRRRNDVGAEIPAGERTRSPVRSCLLAPRRCPGRARPVGMAAPVKMRIASPRRWSRPRWSPATTRPPTGRTVGRPRPGRRDRRHSRQRRRCRGGTARGDYITGQNATESVIQRHGFTPVTGRAAAPEMGQGVGRREEWVSWAVAVARTHPVATSSRPSHRQ